MDNIKINSPNNALTGKTSVISADNTIYYSAANNIVDKWAPNVLDYYEDQSFSENQSRSYNDFPYDERRLPSVHGNDEKFNNRGYVARKFPENLHLPKFQTNYFDEDYKDYSQVVQHHYGPRQHPQSSKSPSNPYRQRTKLSPTVKRNRPNISQPKRRKFYKPSMDMHGIDSLTNYDPWKDIYQQGVFDNHKNKNRNTTSSSTRKSDRATSVENNDQVENKGYQVMASNLLYKTKASEDSVINTQDNAESSIGRRNDETGFKTKFPKLSIEEEGQFAADFQQQNQNFRWGQGIDDGT